MHFIKQVTDVETTRASYCQGILESSTEHALQSRPTQKVRMLAYLSTTLTCAPELFIPWHFDQPYVQAEWAQPEEVFGPRGRCWPPEVRLVGTEMVSWWERTDLESGPS